MATVYYLMPAWMSYDNAVEGDELLQIAVRRAGHKPLFHKWSFADSLRDLLEVCRSMSHRIVDDKGNKIPVDDFIANVVNWKGGSIPHVPISNLRYNSPDFPVCTDDEGYEFTTGNLKKEL